MSPLVTFNGVYFRIGKEDVLQDINFVVEANSFTTLIGPNGAGKSTLLQLLIGQQRPTRGKITIHSDVVLGYVPQRLLLNQLMPMTVRDFLRLYQRETGCKHERLFGDLGIALLAHKSLHDLSGGELRRVLLARSLSRHPNLLVLDEPTQGLDINAQGALYDYLSYLHHQKEITIVLVSHDMHFVHRASSHVLCLNRHICCQGRPNDLEDMPDYSAFMSGKTPSLYAQHLKPYVHDHEHQPGSVRSSGGDDRNRNKFLED